MSRSKMGWVIYNDLLQRIIEGRLSSGCRIGEKELSLEYGASRTPVREALQLLQEQGFVEIRDGIGTFVRETSREELIDAYDVRRALELTAVEKSIGRMTDGELDELNGRFTDIRRKLSSGIPCASDYIAKADWALHDLIIRRANNRFLDNAALPSTMVLKRYQYNFASNFSRATDEHLEIIRLLRARDLDNVKKLLAEHVSFRTV